MNMFLGIEKIAPQKLVGNKVEMNYANNKTFELWRNFMPRRTEISSVNPGRLYSLQVYRTLSDFTRMTPNTMFTKWAALEVADFEKIPTGMEALVTTGGLYAIFIHRGPSSRFATTMTHIFVEWMPVSGYEADHREQFEILGEKYKRESDDSEEEVWIPIRQSPELRTNNLPGPAA
jgi:AraC family transcriptional regulator